LSSIAKQPKKGIFFFFFFCSIPFFFFRSFTTHCQQQQGKEHAGTIDFRAAKVNKSSKKPNKFDLVLAMGKTVTLVAETAEEAEQWCKALLKAQSSPTGKSSSANSLECVGVGGVGECGARRATRCR
jgi:hypothetical protein